MLKCVKKLFEKTTFNCRLTLISIELAACLLATLGAAGCASSSVDIRQRPIAIEGPQDLVYQAIRKELTGRGFELDKVNRRRGEVETHALLSKQWFEFWRQDVVSDEAAAEASLQTIRRRVQVTVKQIDSGRRQLDCHVSVERQVSELARTRNQVRSQNVFYRAGGPVPSLAARDLEENVSPRWQKIDCDDLLEKAILAGIMQRLEERL
jgi:hypothetical protein